MNNNSYRPPRMGTTPRYSGTAVPSPYFDPRGHETFINGGVTHRPSHRPEDFDTVSPEQVAKLQELAQDTGNRALKALDM